jgi:putative ABC transport system permease protein
MLAIGGAMFMAAINVSAGWNRAVNEDFARRRYDLSLQLAQKRPVAEVRSILAAIPEVTGVESWPSASVWLIGADGVAGSRINLLGLDPDSPLLAMNVVAGRWLDPAHPEGVVINNAVLALNPTLRAGGTIGIRIEGRTHQLPIVGVARELTPQAVVYTGRSVLAGVAGVTSDSARTYRIVTREHTDAAQLAAARTLEQTFAERGMEVSALQRMSDAKKGILDHLVIIMVILTLSASIVVLVGAIGLTSTLTINVVQRTREIGVMSAIGAAPRTIAGQIWGEAIAIGLLSWLVAALLAMPVTWLLQTVTGRMFFRIPLDFTLAADALGLWLALVILLSSLSSFYPAWRAARLPVREALAHV